MIKSIRIKNFKCFGKKECRINHLYQFNFISGKNGTGKTTLLQEIAMQPSKRAPGLKLNTTRGKPFQGAKFFETGTITDILLKPFLNSFLMQLYMMTPFDCILIDTLESGIHYTSYSYILSGLIEFSIQSNLQIIASTYSRELVEKAYIIFKEKNKPFGYVRLEKKENNIIPVEYNMECLRISFENFWEIR